MIRILLTAILLSSASTGLTQPAPTTVSAPAPSLYLRGGLWFDGTRFVPDSWFAVGGKLTRARPPRVDVTVDLDGRYVIPPLAEAHNHDLQNAWGAGRNASAYLARGIFYTGQFCAMPEDVMSYRGLMGTSAAPDVLWAEACISASDGHPLGIALAGAKQAGMAMTPAEVRNKHYWSVDTLTDLEARWPDIAQAKPALVKVILIDSASYEANRKKADLFGFNGLNPALVPEVVKRARAIGARVAAHVDTGADFANAVAGGVDMIAHLPGYRIASGKKAADYRISEEAAAEAARRKVMVITTTAASRFDIARHPEHAATIRASYTDNIRRLRAAGVTLLTGSDVFNGSVLDEVESLDGLQVMGRADLLRLVTGVTPRAMFPDRNIGQFAQGAEASLVVLQADPLADLTALRRPSMLIKNGALLSPAL